MIDFKKAFIEKDGNNPHMQGQECFKGISGKEREGGCNDYEEFI